MFSKQNIKSAWIYIFPFSVIIWSAYLLQINGPFYLTRIDPDYVYLLNGLNVARFDFSKIGHIDHPGTPFQVLTGIFIRLIHWVAGRGPIVDDVATRPEFYLFILSTLLSILTAIIILWLGKVVLSTGKDILGALIMQSSLFVNIILIELPGRYIPDRMLSLVALVFLGFCVKYLYAENYTSKKFAIHSGIILGIGFVTKFNFLPLLVIPLFLLLKMKDRFLYIISLTLSSIISFLPIYDKFTDFRRFIFSIVNHDGLYGSGSQKIIDTKSFLYNTILIFKENYIFSILLLVSILLVIVLWFKHRKTFKKELLYFISLYVVVLLGTILTAKHYKHYYFIPVLSLTGFTVYVLLKIGRKLFNPRLINIIFSFLLVFMVCLPMLVNFKTFADRPQENYNTKLTAEFINENVNPNEYILIEPTWMSGLTVSNGLIYGLSYIRDRNYYYNEFERNYANVITWNGFKKPLESLKMIDMNNETIFKSGRNIVTFSTPGRYSDEILSYIDSCSNIYGIPYLRDTIYENLANNNYVIRLQNVSGWYEKTVIKCGFEKITGNILLSDDEKFALNGQFNVTEKFASNGANSLTLNSILSKSPDIRIQNVQAGDYIEVSVKRKRGKQEKKGNLNLCIKYPDGQIVKLAEGKFISVIHYQWELLRLETTIKKIPENGELVCFYNFYGPNIEYIDDFTVKHFSKQPEKAD
jgi:hypothetical protein